METEAGLRELMTVVPPCISKGVVPKAALER